MKSPTDILGPAPEPTRGEERAVFKLMREQFQRRIAELELLMRCAPDGPCLLCRAPREAGWYFCDDCVLHQAGEKRARWWCDVCAKHVPIDGLCEGCGADY